MESYCHPWRIEIKSNTEYNVHMDQRKIAFFDIDKTIYNGYMIFPLAEYFFEENIIKKDTLDYLYEDLRLYRSKQVDYETTVENFNIHFAYGLKNYSPAVIFSSTKVFLKTRESSNFFVFTEPLIELLSKTHDIYFITGEVQFVGKAVEDYFSVQGYISSEMEVKNDVFTGNISKSLARKEGKSDAIESLFNEYPYENSMAFGDSEGDIDMLSKVAHAFCINSTEGLMEVASLKKWNVVTPDSIIEACSMIIYSNI
jgi:HAD superfamily phosphoserine phosphatase-like hydrolase